MIKSSNKELKPYIVYILLGVVSFGIYSKVLTNQFINLDDPDYVTENFNVKTGLSLENIKWAFTAYRSANWHPLTWISHMVDCELFGLKPWGHHLTNLLLHIINVLLLFAILRMMTGAVWRSAFAAAAFALHPLHVESVAWVAERKDVLSTLFWMLTMLGYVKYVRKTSKGWYVVTLVFFVLGLMSKPMLVTIPFVLLLLDYWPLERLKSLTDWKTARILFVEKIPFFIFSAGSSVITFFVQRAGGAMSVVPLHIRIMNAVLSYAKYILMMLWPSDLAVLYPLTKKILIVQTVGAAVLLGIITIIALRILPKRRYFLIGWLWYVGTLVPVIGLVQVGSQALADRYTYIPLIGLFILIGWSVGDLIEKYNCKKQLVWMAGILVIAAMSIKTYIQVGHWKDNFSLYKYTLAITQDNSIIHNNLGAAYADSKDYENAVKHCSEAIKIWPGNAEAYCNLGSIYEDLGRYKEAIESCDKAMKIIKSDKYASRYSLLVKVYNGLGVVYSKIGRHQEAIKILNDAIQMMPSYGNTFFNLGTAYGRAGQFMKALDVFKEVANKDKNSADVYFNLGLVYSKLGDSRKAIEMLKTAISLKPQWIELYSELSMAYERLGRNSEAIETLKKAVELKPDYADGYFNLGLAYSRNGEPAKAISCLKEAIRLNPDDVEARFNLGVGFLAIGDRDKAMEEYKILNKLNPQMAMKLLQNINK